MANREHLAILNQGVEAWNRWRLSEPHVLPDLADADLRNCKFYNAHFGGARLWRVTLTEADLTWADLGRCDLQYANLRGANLGGASIVYADLSSADLTSCHLGAAYLVESRLKGANFTEAKAGRTVFAGLDLRSVNGLASMRHAAPSYVTLDTIVKSHGEIAMEFLRGSGSPESVLNFVKSLSRYAIDFFSCFISYCGEDQPFADRLYADLQQTGVRCWFAPHDIQSGKKLHEQIDQAIRVYDRLLLILSDHSMNSEWVKTEIASARQRELREKHQMLFPISLVPFERIKEWKAFDADTGKDSAREIREYFIPDFSNWKNHDSYQQAFERLLRDLKAEPYPPPSATVQPSNFRID